MKNKHGWIGIGAGIAGFLFGIFSVSLEGVLSSIPMEWALLTVYGLLLFVGVISLLIALYYLRKSREFYVAYQSVEDDLENEQSYLKMYRYLDYGTVASNILMISMIFCLVVIASPVFEMSYLTFASLIFMVVSFATGSYCMKTISLIRQYKLSLFSMPNEVMDYLDSYDEGEKQAEMESAYLILFKLNQIFLPSLYIVLLLLSKFLQELQLVALLLLVVIHFYINFAQLRKTKRYFR
ncbi:DUF3169 family protein [Falseniella ignava]